MSKKSTNTKEKVSHIIYSFFAGIVILGALFKITHMSIGFLDGNTLLMIGLIAEASIFFYAAFFDQPQEDYHWERVYPGLLDESAGNQMPVISNNATNSPSQSRELDTLLSEAKLDKEFFENLRTSLDKFGSAVAEINKTASAAASTETYNSEISKASVNISTLNALYQQQIESSNKQLELNGQFIDKLNQSSANSEQFLSEMKVLSENISALNKVYGGMLSAMKGNQ